MSTTVEFDLKELLEKLDAKIDKLGSDLNNKVDNLSSNLNTKIDKLSDKVDNVSDDINKLNVTVTRLDEQVANAVKRIDSIEFAKPCCFNWSFNCCTRWFSKTIWTGWYQLKQQA